MRKQKSSFASFCKCQEYKQEITKMRSKLLYKLKPPIDIEEYSTYRLLKMHLLASQEREKILSCMQSQLREFMRMNPTIEYSEGMGVGQMVTSLILRIRKEKDIHSSALKKEKERAGRHVKEHRTAAEEIDYLKELLLEEQTEQETWKNQALKQQKLNKSLRKEIQLKKEENRLLKELTKKLELKINSLEIKVSSLEKDKSQLSREFIEKSQEVAKLAADFRSFKGQLSYSYKLQLNKQIQSYKSQISTESNPQTTRLSINKNQAFADKAYLFNHLFVGDVLFNEDESHHFLIEVIQNHQRNPIVRTRLIFKTDPMNSINLHRYMDGIAHLVILIRTQGGQVIAAYSEGAFKPRTISNKDGLIMNLTTQKVYRNTKKAIMYDQDEIVFGNFDLKFRNGDSKIFSNLCTSNSFYDCKGQSVGSSLLGQGKGRECRMKGLQIFQILFEL